MTTKEKMNDLLRALDGLKGNFNLNDLGRIIDLAKDIYGEIDAMERDLEDFKKAA